MTVTSARRCVPRVLADLAELSPANFAMVMATGIISIGLHLRGFALPAIVLFCLNLAAWTVLWMLTALRLLRRLMHYVR